MIELLMKYDPHGGFFHYYKGYYEEIEFDTKFLQEHGLEYEEKEIMKVESIFNELRLDQKDLIPDILFFINVINVGVKTAEFLKVQQAGTISLDILLQLKELSSLIDQTEKDNYERIEKIQFKIHSNTNVPPITVKNQELIKQIMQNLKKLISEIDINKELSFSEDKLKDFYLQFGKQSINKDNLKASFRKKSCILLREYILWKKLLGMNNNDILITDDGAIFIGKCLAITNLIEFSEEEFKKNESLSKSYNVKYNEYLKKAVRSYLSDGRKSV